LAVAPPRLTHNSQVDNLYDVFCNIRDDEAQHVSTMEACQDPTALTKSPNAVAAATALALGLGATNYALSKYVRVALASPLSILFSVAHCVSLRLSVPPLTHLLLSHHRYASNLSEVTEVTGDLSGLDGFVSTLVDLDLELIIDAITALITL
jgi:hypothetical protein